MAAGISGVHNHHPLPVQTLWQVDHLVIDTGIEETIYSVAFQGRNFRGLQLVIPIRIDRDDDVTQLSRSLLGTKISLPA